MRQFGLIGQSLAHSWSPRWFAAHFERQGITDACYCLYEMEGLDGLRELIEKEQLQGFNVTIPYKEAIIPYLDQLDDHARAIGAVNCVTVESSRLTGHNTDAPAFLDTLQPLLRPCHTAALVLGTGGAAKAVKYALESIGIDVQLVSRTPEAHPGSISYATAVAESARRLLIVNATPMGMFPHTDASPWPTNSVPTPTMVIIPKRPSSCARAACMGPPYATAWPCSTAKPNSAGPSGTKECNGLLHRSQ